MTNIYKLYTTATEIEKKQRLRFKVDKSAEKKTDPNQRRERRALLWHSLNTIIIKTDRWWKKILNISFCSCYIFF